MFLSMSRFSHIYSYHSICFSEIKKCPVLLGNQHRAFQNKRAELNFLSMLAKPFLARRRVAFTWLVSSVVSGRRGFPTRVGAKLSTVIAAYNLWPHDRIQVSSAFLAEKGFVIEDCLSLKYSSCATIRAFSGAHWRGLALPAHWIANPASSRHRFASSFRFFVLIRY